MLRPTWSDVKLWLTTQVRRLAHQADARLIGFSSTLLGLDLFFITVFSIHRIRTASHNDGTPRLGIEWQIGQDWSYAEILGYVKLGIVVSALASIRAKRERPIYPALALMFTVVLLDDALRLHERLGGGVANALALRYSALGDLMVWMIFGVCLLTVVHAAFVRSPQEDRSNGLLLLGSFAVLVLFAVGADLAHVVVLHQFRTRAVDSVLTVIEDGGEQITLTLICSLALLLRRELCRR
jgi:hypothetical protein